MKTIPHQKVKLLIIAFCGALILSFVAFQVITAIKNDRRNSLSKSETPISELAPYSILTPPTWLYKRTSKNTEFAYDKDSAGLRVKIGDNEYLVKTNSDGTSDIYTIGDDGSLTKVEDDKTRGMVNSAVLDILLNGKDEAINSLLKNNIPSFTQNVSGSSFTDDELQTIIDMANASSPSSLTLENVKERLKKGEKLSSILNNPTPSLSDDEWLDNFLENSGITKDDFLSFLDSNSLSTSDFRDIMDANGIKSYEEFKKLKDKAYPSYADPNSILASRALSNRDLSSRIVPNPPDRNILPNINTNDNSKLELTPLAYNPSTISSGSSMDSAIKNLSTSPYKLQNDQQNKIDFQANGADTKIEGSFLTSNDITVGTIIPCILINGINTDLPGSIIAQTTQNIYDSLNHTNILLPKGTRLFADYNSVVSFGQNRVQVVFKHLARPDGYYTNLPNFIGTDELGRSGYSGELNNQTGAFIGGSILSALIDIGLGTVGAQVQDNTLNSIVKAFTDNTQKTADKYLDKIINKQPTIKIAPGTNVSILVNKNLTLPDVKK